MQLRKLSYRLLANGNFPFRKALNREAREIKVRKQDFRAREVLQTGHDDKRKAEKAQLMNVKQKPLPPVIPPMTEVVPEESEGVKSPDVTPEKFDGDAPPTAEPDTPDEQLPQPPDKKTFSYLHGSVIPAKPPERRSDPYKPE